MFRLIVAFFLILSGILLVIGNIKPNQQEIIGNYNTFLIEQCRQDSITIDAYFKSADDRHVLNDLNDSPFFIEIYKNDTIVYWTDQTEINEVSPNNIVEIKTIGDSTYHAIVRLNLSGKNSRQVQHLMVDHGFKNSFIFNEHQSKTSNLKLGSISIPVSIQSSEYGIQLKTFSWILFFVVFMMLTLKLIDKIKHQLAQQIPITTSLFGLGSLIFGFTILNRLSFFTALFKGFCGFTSLNVFSFFNDTLSSLVINLWSFGILIYLLNLYFSEHKKYLDFPRITTFLTGFISFLLFGSSLYLIEGFVMNSQVNLEIEALIQFNIVSFALIICFSILMILVFQCTQLLYELIEENQLGKIEKYGLIALGWAISLLLMWQLDILHVPLWIFIAFVVSYSLILDAYVENKEKKITYLIWWLIMFSGFLAVSLFHFGLKKDVIGRQYFLDQYYVNADDNIKNALVQFQDSLIDSGIFSKIASPDAPAMLDLEDLSQYIFEEINYDTTTLDLNMELFDKNGNTLLSNHFANFFKTNQSFKNAKQIARNIYHNPFEDKYFMRFEIAKTISNNTTWYLFIIHQNTNLERKQFLAENLPNQGFAVFSNQRLIEKNEAFQAMPDIGMMNSLTETQVKSGYSFVVSIPSSQYKVVSYKKVSDLIKPISLFSFIFTLCGLILLVLSLINTKYDFLPENISLKFGSRSSLKTKIQLAIILLILVTFLVIGAITGYYFKNLIEANQKNKNKEETTSIINNIISDIQNLPDDESALSFLNTKLKEFSLVHDKELSLYNDQGKLIGSSIKGINQMRIPFAIWDKTNQQNTSLESANTLPVNDAQIEYVPIFLNDENPLAYIVISHKSYNNSARSILDFLSTILNAYIFLFLIAGAIAITIANSITQPLSILTDKLKKFKLGKTNEPLEWKSNDEIGTLIHDYNNLTHELERSAGLLAKTERDLAWREMAKQVAHEIKNPLTPMKLSIQYLERTAKDYPDKATELIPRISSTLIEQIDNLTQIANEFSNFASMPQASNEKIILNEIVETIHDLFRKRDDMDINMIEPIDDLYVFADRNHLIRILNNLLKNAIQAIPDNRRGKIEIALSRQGNDAIIRVTDNGIGIPDQMKDKVFTPNFTTKSSGTGLGLAISANMIESFNGRIYFETQPNEGTDFFVAIPLMRLDDYFKDEERVSLD